MASLNNVCVSGNLTRDPELRQLPSGTSVCQLRLAVNDRFKDKDGTWQDRAFYFDVTVWAGQGENAAKYLSKGSGVIIQGTLRWREWETDDGTKRQAVDINAREVIFMPKGGGSSDGGGGGGGGSSSGGSQPRSAPIGDDDDIPF